MARPIVLSNGQMSVGLNNYGLVHDFYFPYVGLENHTAAKNLRHRVGVHCDDGFSWLDDGSWDISYSYHDQSLLSHVTALNNTLGIYIEFDDFVDNGFCAFIRNIHIVNTRDVVREVKLFLHQVFDISDSHMSDTVQYHPNENFIIHYKGHRVFIANALHDDGSVFDDYSVGLFACEGHEGTYKDAEDGVLSKNAVEHGRVDSTIGMTFQMNASESKRAHYWIAAGKSVREAKKINDTIVSTGVHYRMRKTVEHWSNWTSKLAPVTDKLPESHQKNFVNSALLIRSAIDNRGAVIASIDTTMLNYSRDSYAYCWPRDAVYVLWPLLRLGYEDELVHFFAFCRRILSEEGYLGHKFQADGALGSSWHPYTHHDGPDAPPIQTDETAVVLFLFGQYYRMHPEKEFLDHFYGALVKPMADFLANYVDDDGLPLPSYDLWEEKYLTTTYTTAATYAALLEASRLAGANDNRADADRWKDAAVKMYSQRSVFYNKEKNYFFKGFIRHEDVVNFDDTVDSSSFFGAFMFGYFGLKEPEMTESYTALEDQLLVNGQGVIRYVGDDYYRLPEQQSNIWPIASLWRAQYLAEVGETTKAWEVLDWVASLMTTSGTLAEQYTSELKSRSVRPLTWSQAEYMSALLDIVSDSGGEQAS